MRQVFSQERIGSCFIWGHSSVCKNCVGLNGILFRNYALIQYSFCGVTIAYEYGEKPLDECKNASVSVVPTESCARRKELTARCFSARSPENDPGASVGSSHSATPRLVVAVGYARAELILPNTNDTVSHCL